MKNKTKTIIAEMLPFIMADGSQEAGEHEFSPNEIAMHGTMMICDATCNEIRACMMESLGFQHRGNDEGMEALIERMLEVKPYRFCQERLKQGDLRQLLSNPSFLREAHRRWASQSGFQSGPILAKAPDWGKLQKEATSDLTTAAATAEEVVQAIEENKGYCFRTAYSMLGNMTDAEDACQQAFLNAWKAAEQMEPEGNPRAWLARITRNVCINYLWKKKSKAIVSLFDFDGALAFDCLDTRENTKDLEFQDYFDTVIQPEIDQLSDEQREALELNYRQGMEVREIAAELDKPLSSIYTLRRRALEKLRNELSG